jgi:catechol 2,3-dioxygenase-like lactoylglutathione lyase family enzyme
MPRAWRRWRRSEAARVAVRREPASLADQRFVRDVISFRDPTGNRLEAFYGPLLADTPCAPGRSISGFRTGVEGMGHVVLMVADFEAALAFYQDLLGFQISDYMRTPRICFLHVNARHHSLALFEHPRQGMPAPPTARPQTLKLGPLLFASQIVFISFPHHNASVTDNLVVSAMNGYESVAAPSFKLAKQRFFRLPSSGIGLAC